MQQAADAVFLNQSIAVPAMLYGPDEGDERLRKELSKWLTEFYSDHIKDDIGAERLAITGGASQNLACLLQTYTDPEYTRNIWIVAPSYFLAFRIFNDSGFGSKLRSVPEDEEGLGIEYLRQQIALSEDAANSKGNTKPAYKVPTAWGKIYKHVIYAVPTFSNPSSKTMSLRRREEVVRLAREYDALIITDDVYDQLQWPAEALASSQTGPTIEGAPLRKSAIPRIVDIDRYLDGGAERHDADGFGNAATNGSFSKLVGPGMRTGWCEGTPKLAWGVAQTGSSRSGGAPSHIAGTFLAEALATGGVQKHVYEVLQPAYAKRWRLMMDAIRKYLVPLGVKLPQEDRDVVGGYFIWLRLPPHIKANLLARRCKDTNNLIIADGRLFEVPGDAHLNAWDHEQKSADANAASTAFPYDVRLCFAWEEEDLLEEGIQRLAEVVKAMLDEPVGVNPNVKRQSFGETDGQRMDVSNFK
jgi:DNA-binding transcriptional MocR family regulator